MKIILAGYGKMGKAIEAAALARGHEIVAAVDSYHAFQASLNQQADVVIEFTQPDAAVKNILSCFKAGIPVVSGTTGWHHQLPEVSEAVFTNHGALFYETNFSIGVNLFFAMSKQLSAMFQTHPDYIPRISETHHVHKKDAPSGTAITTAEMVMSELPQFRQWALNQATAAPVIGIEANRIDEVPGTHALVFGSDIDEIRLEHVAFSREGFASGAVKAAEWLQGKKGIFRMNDMLNLW
jgi:4-hydroxy-tetrahydrodipicolinate reductase